MKTETASPAHHPLRSAGFRKEARPRILIASYCFWPSIGGMEAVARLLAERVLQAGYAVSVVTDTPGPGAQDLGYPVIRQPSSMALWRAVGAADMVVVNHPSLRLAWPLLVQSKPFLVAMHTWASFAGPSGMLRGFLFRKADARLAISKAIERCFPVRGKVVPSPYDESVFFLNEAVPRTRDLLFVGRMVSDKGALDLVTALGLLRDKGITPTASFVGDGPDREAVEALIRKLSLEGQVLLHGSCAPPRVASLMREHRILVVPSVWDEPFGIVALEGIACGCVVIGTSGGGLPEAMGPCGLAYPNGKASELAQRIDELLGNPDLVRRLRAEAEAHLARHTGRAITARYLELFHEILAKA